MPQSEVIKAILPADSLHLPQSEVISAIRAAGSLNVPHAVLTCTRSRRSVKCRLRWTDPVTSPASDHVTSPASVAGIRRRRQERRGDRPAEVTDPVAFLRPEQLVKGSDW